MSREEIIDKITAVAVRMGLDLRSVWVTFIINMSAEIVYLWQGISTWKVLEASLFRCTQINSALQHVSDLMYCTDRGSLPVVKITNAIALHVINVKKYDLCAEIGGIKYYYNQDVRIDNPDGVTTWSFELLASLKEIQEVEFISERMYYDLQDPCTMDFQLVLGRPVKVHRHLRDVHDKEPYMQVTIPDYKLRIINNNIFSGNDTYKIRYFPYPEYDFTSEIQIESLPQFRKMDAEVVKPFIPRNEDIDNIKLSGVTENKSNFLMATRNDIDNFILSSPYLQGLACINIKLETDRITIYYILEDLNATISKNNQDAFIESLTKAYYITQDIVFEKAQTVDCDMQLKIYYKEMINETLVNNRLDKIAHRIGVDLVYDELIAELTRSIPEISFIDQIQPVGDKCQKVAFNQRINFTQTDIVIYEPYEEGSVC